MTPPPTLSMLVDLIDNYRRVRDTHTVLVDGVPHGLLEVDAARERLDAVAAALGIAPPPQLEKT